MPLFLKFDHFDVSLGAVDQYKDDLVDAWLGFFRAQRSGGAIFLPGVTEDQKKREIEDTIDAMIRGDESPDPFGPYDMR